MHGSNVLGTVGLLGCFFTLLCVAYGRKTPTDPRGVMGGRGWFTAFVAFGVGIGTAPFLELPVRLLTDFTRDELNVMGWVGAWSAIFICIYMFVGVKLEGTYLPKILTMLAALLLAVSGVYGITNLTNLAFRSFFCGVVYMMLFWMYCDYIASLFPAKTRSVT